MKPRALALIPLILFGSGTASASSQTLEPEAGAAVPEKVDIPPEASDGAIERRLRGVLAATGRVEDLQVTVDGGVVFLRGRVASTQHQEWAEKLALHTTGVAAVVNDLAVKAEAKPLLSLEPAWLEIEDLVQALMRRLPLLALGTLVLLFSLLVARAGAGLTERWLSGMESLLVRQVLCKVAFLLIFLAGAYLFLRISGLERLAVTVLGSTGIVGLALGFAFRDIAENFLASLLISIQRPFRLGDTIEVGDHRGVVQKVTMRGTLLMDFDGNHIQIANSTVYKSTIKNYTANPNQRVSFPVGIGYDSSIRQSQGKILEVLAAQEGVLEDPEPVVLVEELAASTVNLAAYFWIDANRYSVLKVKSAAMRNCLRELEEAGISMPDADRERVFPSPIAIRLLQDREVAKEAEEQRERASKEVEKRRQEVQASPSEQDLRSEVGDIQEQAENARPPEEGADLLSVEGR